MRKVAIRILKKFLGSPFIFDSNNLKFFLGQSAVTSSTSSRSEFKDLWDSEVKVYSQWGEDGIINFILDKIGLAKPNILEIGVGDFSECNSRFAIEYRNASAVLIDTNSELENGVKRSGLLWKSHIFPINAKVDISNCVELYAQAEKLIGTIDVLSLDIDSNDYWIIDKLEKFENLKLIIVEYNPLFGSEAAISIPYSQDFLRFSANVSGLYYGASLQAMCHILGLRDFILLGTNRICNNAFFIRKSDLSQFTQLDIPDTTNLKKYVDWRCRDSRNEDGELTYSSGEARLKLIAHEKVQDVKNNKIDSLLSFVGVTGFEPAAS